MKRRVLEVELTGVGSLVRGPGARELVVTVTGRAPVWSSIRRGWSVQQSTARDVIAAAEIRNYDILIAGPRSARAYTSSPPDVGHPDISRPPVVEQMGGLW